MVVTLPSSIRKGNVTSLNTYPQYGSSPKIKLGKNNLMNTFRVDRSKTKKCVSQFPTSIWNNKYYCNWVYADK